MFIVLRPKGPVASLGIPVLPDATDSICVSARMGTLLEELGCLLQGLVVQGGKDQTVQGTSALLACSGLVLVQFSCYKTSLQWLWSKVLKLEAVAVLTGWPVGPCSSDSLRRQVSHKTSIEVCGMFWNVLVDTCFSPALAPSRGCKEAELPADTSCCCGGVGDTSACPPSISPQQAVLSICGTLGPDTRKRPVVSARKRPVVKLCGTEYNQVSLA